MHTPEPAEDCVRAVAREYGLWENGARVTLALSGGRDSMVLLHALLALRGEYDLEISAAHLNHALRGNESDRDEAFVRGQCAALGVPLTVHRLEPGELRAHGEGIEAVARAARYAFLEDCAGDGLIATAHTLDDAAETLLLNLARGAGTGGLCGIPPKRGHIVRPLIDCPRALVRDYAAQRGIPFMEDSTNATDVYARNRVRHHILPQLYALNLSLDKALARMFRAARQDDEALTDLARAFADSQTGDAAAWLALPPAVRVRALRIRFAECCPQMLEAVHFEALEALLERGSGCVSLPQRCEARVWRGRLYFLHSPARWDVSVPLTLEPVRTPYGTLRFSMSNSVGTLQKIHKLDFQTVVDYDMIKDIPVVRPAAPGDRMRPAGRGFSKPLAGLYAEKGIPPWDRRRPVLADGDGVLWAVGIGADERVRPREGSGRLLHIMFEGNVI